MRVLHCWLKTSIWIRLGPSWLSVDRSYYHGNKFNSLQYFVQLGSHVLSYTHTRMCYQLHFNTGINKVLLPRFLANFLGYLLGKKTTTPNIACIHNGYLYIEPCRLAHGIWYLSSGRARCHYQTKTQKHKHCLYGNALSLNPTRQRLLRISANYFIDIYLSP